MDVFVCLDDRGGMFFNHRRQSRDREVIQDMLDSLDGKPLYIRPYSQVLFQGREEAVRVVKEFWETALVEKACFIEDLPLAPFAGEIRTLTVYLWNRRYPADVFLDVDLSGWRRVSCWEFPGHSHERISKEVYCP